MSFEFFPLQDYTFRIVLIGTVALGILSGMLGSFLTMRRESLLGDGMAHSSYPGIMLAFLVTGVKDLEGLLLGAFLTVMAAVGIIHIIRERTRLPFDGTLATVLSSFFGFGLVLSSYIQQTGNAHQAGLNRFLFGQASALSKEDVTVTVFLALIVLLMVLFFWKEWSLLAFDRNYLAAGGLPVGTLNALFTMCTALTVLLSIQAVGIILMSAMLIAPAISARQWTKHFGTMTILSAAFGGIASAFGTAISSSIPHMPAGPCIVVVATLITAFSLLTRKTHMGGAV